MTVEGLIFMRKVYFSLLLVLLVAMAGCNMENTVSRVKRVDTELVGPAVKVLEEFRRKEKETLKAKPGLAGYQVMAKLAEAELPRLKEIQEKLKAEPVIKMTDSYLYFSRLYVDRIIVRLETVVKAGTDGAAKLRNHQGMLRLLDGRLLAEAKLGYDRERNMLLDKRESYQLTSAYVKHLKKGQTYEQVMWLFRMPGTFMPVIREVRGGKTVTHQPVIWQHEERLVYVDFVNGKAESWKCQRPDGFW